MKNATQTSASACQRRGSRARVVTPSISSPSCVSSERSARDMPLVPEMAAAGEDHRRAGLLRPRRSRPGRASSRPAGRSRSTPASSAICGPSGNGKNASEASAAPVEVVAVLGRLLDGDPHGVDAAHLAGADPDRREVLREDDRVRRDVLADAPREDEVAPLRSSGLPHDDLPAVAVLDLRVGVLDEHARRARACSCARRARRARRSRSTRMRVFCLRAQRGERVLV